MVNRKLSPEQLDTRKRDIEKVYLGNSIRPFRDTEVSFSENVVVDGGMVTDKRSFQFYGAVHCCPECGDTLFIKPLQKDVVFMCVRKDCIAWITEG